MNVATTREQFVTQTINATMFDCDTALQAANKAFLCGAIDADDYREASVTALLLTAAVVVDSLDYLAREGGAA